MDLYTTSLILGAAGLAVMGLGGVGHHSHAGSTHGHASGHGHASHGHASHGHGGHAHLHGPAHGGAHAPSFRESASRGLLSVLSPRVLFSVRLGFGNSAGGLVAVLGR